MNPLRQPPSSCRGIALQKLALQRLSTMWWPFKNKPSAPTPHHYVLAHVALRQIAREDPLKFFAEMASPGRDDLMKWIWEQVCESCDDEGKAAFSIDDVKVSTVRCAGYPTLLIRMPPPREVAEAHMVCIVLELEDDTEIKGTPPVAYYTLERGMSLDGIARTVLCSWDEGGVHANYGDGPSVDEAAFLEAVEEHLRDDKDEDHSSSEEE